MKRLPFLLLALILPMIALAALHDIAEAQTGACPSGTTDLGILPNTQPSSTHFCKPDAGTTQIVYDGSLPCGGVISKTDSYLFVALPSSFLTTQLTVTLDFIVRGPTATNLALWLYDPPVPKDVAYLTITNPSTWYPIQLAAAIPTATESLRLNIVPDGSLDYTSFRLTRPGETAWSHCPDPSLSFSPSVTPSYLTYSITWPTPFPTPETPTVTLNVDPFWDIDTYLGMANAAQSFWLVPGIQKALSILMLMGSMVFSLSLIRRILAQAKASDE